jgi:hypothetical protein
MVYSFSKHHAENVSSRRVPASGVDEEAVHRIRRQGRIQRAKIRQCLARLKRIATPAHLGGGV